MAITAAAPTREHEKPMSWARAVAMAVGIFFLAAILLGQIPSYFFTISTLAKLTRMEQGFLDLARRVIGKSRIHRRGHVNYGYQQVRAMILALRSVKHRAIHCRMICSSSCRK